MLSFFQFILVASVIWYAVTEMSKSAFRKQSKSQNVLHYLGCMMYCAVPKLCGTYIIVQFW